MTSPSQSFIQKIFSVQHEGNLRSALVLREDGTGGAAAGGNRNGMFVAMSDTFVVRLPRTRDLPSDEIIMPKNEIVLALAASKEAALRDVKEKDLH